MTEHQAAAAPLSGRTAWARSVSTPLREFLRTETGGAVVLLAGALIALAWANVHASSYQTVWGTQLSVRLGDFGISQDLRRWVNSGLMTFFFLERVGKGITRPRSATVGVPELVRGGVS